MSHILAIDTSTDACSVAISTPSGVHQTLSVSPREHTQRLLPAVESLLAQHELSLSQCDAIAFGAGPGSFTGLRIGLSTAQGLAYGADLPLIPISTLKAMAYSAIRLQGLVGKAQAVGQNQQGEGSDGGYTVIPMLDARMNEVYVSAFHVDTQGDVRRLMADAMSAPEQAALFDMPRDSQLYGVGSGWLYPCIQERFDCQAQYDTYFYPHAYDVALLAADDYQSGNVESPLTVTPTYLRNEISWKKRQRIRKGG